MKAAGGGKIVNIGSMLSIFGAGFAAAYGASKGGVVQLTKALATAWAKDNIQVNAVLPGWIDTDLTRAAREQVRGLNTMVLMRTPVGRWGVPADWRAWRCSWRARRPTSSPAPRSPSMAATRCRFDTRHPGRRAPDLVWGEAILRRRRARAARSSPPPLRGGDGGGGPHARCHRSLSDRVDP